MSGSRRIWQILLLLFVISLLAVRCTTIEHSATPAGGPIATESQIAQTLEPIGSPKWLKDTLTPAATIPSTITPLPTDQLQIPGRIAFISKGQHEGIILMNLNDRTQRLLKTGCLFCDTLSWSPDSRWIAFGSAAKPGESGEIYAISLDNQQTWQITSPPHSKFDPAWSPDGKYIVYVEEGEPTDLVLISADGKSSKKITYTPGYETNPAWSPDGKTIAFLYRDSRFPAAAEIWLMDTDGRNRRKVSDFSAGLAPISWSPDGNQIAFVSSSNCSDIYLIHIDGTNLEKLTTPGCAESPAWSPDGKYIMFVSSDTKVYQERFSGRWQIYVMKIDGSNLIKLTDGDSWVPFHPVWAPGDPP
jgi:Tol biopolymer transport system component